MTEEIEKMNSAALKAEFTAIVDRVRIDKQPVIIQRNNKDLAAIVPLEFLAERTKNKTGKERAAK